ncbi:MAG: GNAT family N-acetyltransferase [Clostridia bacterium]|nr:GNAT family N-acetyltransferase [Clostridia bacterium]
MKISIRPAGENDRLLIKNIFNLYQNELCIYSDDFDCLDENGYFAPDTVSEILPFGDGVFPYIIEENARPVGFIMATDSSFAPDGFDYCLEEIFLIRNRRKRGVADIAMKEIVKDRPGRWTLEVYTQNAPALSFWKRFLSENAECVSCKTQENSPFTRFSFIIRK